MNHLLSQQLPALCQGLSDLTLPRWEKLPDVDLYMDQVLILMDKYLGGSEQDHAITASMINNYVKMGAIPPPEKKKYNRGHLARLLVICVLKNVLPIASVCTVMEQELSYRSETVFYNDFCQQFEESCQQTAQRVLSEGESSSILRAALRCQAEQRLCAEALLSFAQLKEQLQQEEKEREKEKEESKKKK